MFNQVGNYGFLAIYLFSRRGAKGWRDLSQVKQCGYRTFSWYLLGTCFGSMLGVEAASEKNGNGQFINFNRRISQNLQTQSLIRSMQHHLVTR